MAKGNARILKDICSYLHRLPGSIIYHYFALDLRRKFKYQSINSNVRHQSSERPVIIIGMHRSGTSLLCRNLAKLGIHIGWYLGEDTFESFFYQGINRAFFNLMHSRWDQPGNISQLMSDDSLTTRLAAIFYNYHQKPMNFLHFGLRRGYQRRWGWKDPRNTFVFPIWKKVFPSAQIIFIHRNGIDVSQSLFIRNTKNLGKSSYSVTCSNLFPAFDLWSKYNEACVEHVSRLMPNQYVTICYEDLIQHPEQEMDKIVRFLEIDVSQNDLRGLNFKYQSNKAFAFFNDPVLCDLYEHKKNDPMMVKLGYSNLSNPIRTSH